jgi:hypothetical protein
VIARGRTVAAEILARDPVQGEESGASVSTRNRERGEAR